MLSKKNVLIIIPDSKKKKKINKKLITFINKKKIKVIVPSHWKINIKNKYLPISYSQKAIEILSKKKIFETNLIESILYDLNLEEIYYINERYFDNKNLENYKCNIIKTDEIFYNYYKNNTIFKKEYLFFDINSKKILTLSEMRIFLLIKKRYLLYFFSYFKKKLPLLRYYYLMSLREKFSDFDMIKLLLAVYVYKGILKFIYRVIKLIIFSNSYYIITKKNYNNHILFKTLYYYK